jgi:hypothetical protein
MNYFIKKIHEYTKSFVLAVPICFIMYYITELKYSTNKNTIQKIQKYKYLYITCGICGFMFGNILHDIICNMDMNKNKNNIIPLYRNVH